jgi:hypothetical protein
MMQSLPILRQAVGILDALLLSCSRGRLLSGCISVLGSAEEETDYRS